MPIRAIDFALTLMLCAPALAGAQTVSDSGTFVVRHARDTVATEQFTRTETKLDGTLNIRNVKGTSHRWSAVVAPDATLPLIEVTVREGSDGRGGVGRVVQRARVIFKDDSAAVDALGGEGLQTRLFATERGAVPLSADSLRLTIGNVEYRLRVDRAGRLLGGRIPAQDVIAERR